MMKEVYAFDFDGTLTTRDTLLEFIRFTHGLWGLIRGFLLHAPWLVAMKLRLYPNWKTKERIYTYYYKGMEKERFSDLGRQFARTHASLLRPQGIGVIRQALASGADVAVVSASVEDWVRPFFDEMGEKIQFACTQIETREGRVTGRFLTPNCYGAEKVRRLTALFPARETYRLHAFGDSRGDRELLAFADEAEMKPFRRGT